MSEQIPQEKVKDILIKARQRIDKPQKWISFWSQSDDSKRFGADGAIWQVAGYGTELTKQAMHALAEASGINSLWKDSERVCYLCTHREVMAMFDKAIGGAL